jgi:hypothetical protein
MRACKPAYPWKSHGCIRAMQGWGLGGLRGWGLGVLEWCCIEVTLQYAKRI